MEVVAIAFVVHLCDLGIMVWTPNSTTRNQGEGLNTCIELSNQVTCSQPLLGSRKHCRLSLRWPTMIFIRHCQLIFPLLAAFDNAPLIRSLSQTVVHFELFLLVPESANICRLQTERLCPRQQVARLYPLYKIPHLQNLSEAQFISLPIFDTIQL